VNRSTCVYSLSLFPSRILLTAISKLSLARKSLTQARLFLRGGGGLGFSGFGKTRAYGCSGDFIS
jgi:hypothetical protein